MKKLWWEANVYWVILLIYGGIRLFTYNLNTSELGETASYALIIMVLTSASVLIIESQTARSMQLYNFDESNQHENKV